MRKPSLYLLFAIASALSLNATAAVTAPSEAPGKLLRSASYDGTWKGEVNCLHDPGLWPEDECAVQFTLAIQGASISVEQQVRSKSGKETISDINPGMFSFVRKGTNALALSMQSGDDEDGTWVETWSFVMTLEDADHMLVHWTRVVNNTDMPKAQRGSKYSSVGMGEFSRVRSTK